MKTDRVEWRRGKGRGAYMALLKGGGIVMKNRVGSVVEMIKRNPVEMELIKVWLQGLWGSRSQGQ
jgi:hypothetical protein